MHTQFRVGLKRALLLLFSVSAFAIALEANALPSFARQTGMACSACHYQKFPTLNQFGREFKASGFTLTGKQGLVEGENLSLPEVLNASLFTKIRYQKTNGEENPGERTTNSGQLDFPDELSVYFAGRAADNIGFMFEGQTTTADQSFMSGFKMPFSFEVGPVRLLAVPFTTADLGAPFGFEVLNTGAVHNIKVSEHGPETSAQQYIISEEASAAEGAAFVAYNSMAHLNFTKWSPNHATSSQGSPTANYARAALTPVYEGWDLGVGVQAWSGSARQGDGNPAGFVNVLTEAYAVDAQAQKELGGMPLGVYLSHAKSKASDQNGGTPNLFNGGPRDRTASVITTELGFVPNRWIGMLSYRKGDTGDADHSTDNAWTMGLNYKMRQNVIFSVFYSKYSGNHYDADQPSMQPGGTGDSLLTVMMQAGF